MFNSGLTPQLGAHAPSDMISPPLGAWQSSLRGNRCHLNSGLTQQNWRFGAGGSEGGALADASGWYGATCSRRHGGVVRADASGCCGDDTGDECRNMAAGELPGKEADADVPVLLVQKADTSHIQNETSANWVSRAEGLTGCISPVSRGTTAMGRRMERCRPRANIKT